MTTDSINALATEIIGDEGEVLHAYQDSHGFWTIGIGRLIDVRKGGGISHDEALYLFGNDVAKACADLDRKLPWWKTLDDVRQRVLINMTFNMGIGSLGTSGLLSFTRTLAAIRDGKYEEASVMMLNSRWATEVKDRAVRLAEMMRTGLSPKSGGSQ